ncbi:MAG: hypothetical protein CM1200mP41_13620 [Gammaproteobacteria bacterium]|nr:MAG: hypothetical protein CM1200mP41_13620 [Gammaproteobacteria bacterium]
METFRKHQTPDDRMFYRSPVPGKLTAAGVSSGFVRLHPTNVRFISEPVIVSTIRRQMGFDPHPGQSRPRVTTRALAGLLACGSGRTDWPSRRDASGYHNLPLAAYSCGYSPDYRQCGRFRFPINPSWGPLPRV